MARSKAAWSVEIHADISAIEAEWSEITGRHNASPFQCHTFMSMFYRQLVANRLAEPVVALVRAADGRPVALFPMMRSRRHGLTWLRTDERPIDYCSPIIDPSIASAELSAIIRAVLAAVPGVDLLYCNRVPDRFGHQPNPLVDLPNAARLRLSAWMLELAGRTPADLAAARHSNFHGNLRRSTQKLAKSHRRVFSIAEGSDISESDLSAFRAMRIASTADKGRSNIIEEPDWTSFYLGLIHADGLMCKPWLARLEADGEPIAFLFGFSDGQRAVAIMPASLLGPWKPYAPGLQLFSEVMLHFQAAGFAWFDLSIGDMAYKRRFGCEEVGLYDALFPRSLLGHAYYLIWRVKVAIRSRMKPIMPAP